MLLSILIPTRNREKNLNNTLRRLSKAIQNFDGQENLLEVVVVDNFSSDETKTCVELWSQKFPYIKYFKHNEEYFSAEESLFNAVKFTIGKYVWSLGDDDFVAYNSISILMNKIKKTDAEFILLNCDILTPDKKKIIYMRGAMDFIEYDSGLNFFNDFGLISTTTTISCLCFRKDSLNIGLFDELRKLSQIYSHSCALFASFVNKKCAFLSTPIITYRQNKMSDEYDKMSELSYNNHHLDLFSFTTGVIKLLFFLEKELGVEINKIANFEEIELSKDSWFIKQSLLSCFIGNFFIRQLENLVSLNLATENNKQAIKELLEKSFDFFSRIDFQDNLSFEFCDYINDLRQRLDSENWSQSLPLAIDDEKLNYFTNYFCDLEDKHFSKKNISIDKVNQAVLCFRDGKIVKFLRNYGKPINHDETKIVMTILIPSYNRACNLFTLLGRIYNQGINEICDVEILVAVNSCSDETNEVIEIFQKKIGNLRVEHFKDFVDSAEENINRAVPYSKGKYIFILGDDDIILFNYFAFALCLARNSEEVAIVFNNALEVDVAQGSLYVELKGRFPLQKKNMQHLSFENMLRDFGVTIFMAFISRYIIRKDVFLDMSQNIKLSKIYSHIFAFLEFFENKKLLLVDLPIVARGDSIVFNRFKSTSQKNKKRFYYYWTEGLLLHFKNAVNLKLLENGLFFKIREYQPSGQSFYLWKEICAQLCRQSILYLKTLDDAEKPTLDVIELINSFDKRNLLLSDYELLDDLLVEYEKICLLESDNITNLARINNIKNMESLFLRLVSSNSFVLPKKIKRKRSFKLLRYKIRKSVLKKFYKLILGLLNKADANIKRLNVKIERIS